MPDAASPALLADIQATLRAPLPNLVYRRLAAEHPSFLAHAWRLSRPVAASTWLLAAAERVAAEAAPHLPADLPTPAGALAVLDAFGRMNPPNLVLVAAWLRTLRGPRPTPPAARVSLDPRQDAPPPALPPMLDPASHPLLAEVAATNAGQYPSAWRILATWPEYATRAWARTRAHYAQGLVAATAGRVAARASDLASSFPAPLVGLDAGLSDDGEREQVRTLLAIFAEDLIPRLIAELALLRAQAIPSGALR